MYNSNQNKKRVKTLQVRRILFFIVVLLAVGGIFFSVQDKNFEQQIKIQAYFPNSITNLIENPFDYVMEKHCGFSMSGEAAMGEVYTTKGTVAHAIIEELFNPKHFLLFINISEFSS